MSLRPLILLPTSPLPVFTGGQQRMIEMLRRLAQRHELTILGFWRSEEARVGYAQLAAELAAEVIPVRFQRLRPNLQLIPTLLRRRRGQRAGLPVDIPVWDQQAMRMAMQQALATKPIDLIQVEWPYLAPYALAHPELPSLLITHDIFSVALARRGALARNARQRDHLQRQSAVWATYESDIYSRFGLTAAMSALDADIIRERAPNARTVILPNGVDTTALTPGEIRPQVKNLIFVGSPTHPPNLDAACWLLTDIWPELSRRHPDLQLTLVNLDTPEVRARLQPGVNLTGRLPDLLPIYRQADMAMAPLRAGSGTRIKILEAFALGIPVVSTSIGCEGLEVIPDKHLLVADDAPAFIHGVERLLDEHDTRRRLAVAARALAAANYDWDHIVDLQDAAYRSLLARP